MLYAIIYTLIFVPYIYLITYYLNAWSTIPLVESRSGHSIDLPFISVIIPARNEEEKIAQCMEAVINQEYPANLFELIVIDDHSEDGTAAVVAAFSEKNDSIRLIRLSDLPNDLAINSYKKKAIATGIINAKGSIILATDADCIAPRLWLNTIGTCFQNEQPDMIAGPVKFSIPQTKNLYKKFFFIFQALDFMTLQGITGAAIQKKLHYMANGANLAYPKRIFESVQGFKGIDKIASGDDILLMEKISFQKNIRYLKSKQAIVATNPEPTFSAFLNQRIRWAGKASVYADTKIKWIMALVYLVNACLLISAVGAFFSEFLLYLFLVLFFVKFFTDLVFLFSVSAFFEQRKLLWWFVIMEPLHIVYVIVAGWFGAVGNYSWKGRKVK